jgi:hypothetical protein
MRRRIIAAMSVIAVATVIPASPTAFAAPQGTCTTGNYIETTVGSDIVGSFAAPSGASSTGCTWTVPAGVTSVRVLVVAGGGGGGAFHTSGGGGGGGVLHEVGYVVTPGATVNVTVGKGGAGGPSGGAIADNSGANGDNSVFAGLTAVGGGGGGGGGSNSQVGVAGKAGGSGGGGGRCWVGCNTSLTTANANKRAGGAGTSGQGNSGGNAHFINGAGGGGAGAAGSPSTGSAPGNGGDGVSIDISGAPTFFGGGGGGGTETTSTRALGGLGGGGLGGATGTDNGAAGASSTGGGGGGVRSGTPGAGGSGVVMVRWGSAPAAPNISLSASTGYGIINTSVGSLYTISNSGGSVTAYSISPALPAGLTFDTSTGLISGTPTATSSATNYAITARRVSADNGASSSSTATFSFGVFNTAPTTTTTSTTTSTTTTVAASTTTVAAAPTTTVAASQSTAAPVVTSPVVAPAGSTDDAAPATTVASRGATVPTVAATTTTVAPTTTTTTVPAPDAPAASPGEAGATVDGEEVETSVERSDNALVVSAADVTATIYGTNADGERIALDADGNLQLETGDSVVVEASGYEPGSEVEIWLRSTPVQLGVRMVDATGAVSGRFAVPSSVEKGDHRVILSGVTAEGSDSVIGVGLRIGAYGKESGISTWLIVVPLVLATILALVIPTTARRRKRANG